MNTYTFTVTVVYKGVAYKAISPRIAIQSADIRYEFDSVLRSKTGALSAKFHRYTSDGTNIGDTYFNVIPNSKYHTSYGFFFVFFYISYY